MTTPRLTLEFAPGARQVSWLGLGLLLAMAVLTGFAGFAGWKSWASRQQTLSEISVLKSQRDQGTTTRARPAKPDPATEASEKSALAVSKNLMTPWSRLLESLGSAPNQSVALLSMEPSVAKRSVRLTAEAKDWHEMLVYVGALQHDTRLSAVALVSHQVQQQTPGTPVRFVVQAEWGGDPR